MLINPIPQRLCHDAFMRECLVFPLAPPSQNHWSLKEDDAFNDWLVTMAQGRSLGESLKQGIQIKTSLDGVTSSNDSHPRQRADDSHTLAKTESSKDTHSKREEVAMDTGVTNPNTGICATTKPLSHMMEEANLGPKTRGLGHLGDEASGCASVSDNSDVPPEVLAQTKEVLELLHTLHLQALFEMGSVRVVDQVLAS